MNDGCFYDTFYFPWLLVVLEKIENSIERFRNVFKLIWKEDRFEESVNVPDKTLIFKFTLEMQNWSLIDVWYLKVWVKYVTKA